MLATCENVNEAGSRANGTRPLTRSTSTGPKEGLAMKATRICIVDDCDSTLYCRGMCTKHYQRWRAHGSTDPTSNHGLALAERFATFVYRAPSGCWIWLGQVTVDGYGRFNRKVDDTWRPAPAHRVAYEIHVGPIPDGLQIDHLCRVRRCVNPMHLEPVEGWVNLARSSGFSARNAGKVRCDEGHLLAGDNLYIVERPNGVEQRNCRACRRDATRRYRGDGA